MGRTLILRGGKTQWQVTVDKPFRGLQLLVSFPGESEPRVTDLMPMIPVLLRLPGRKTAGYKIPLAFQNFCCAPGLSRFASSTMRAKSLSADSGLYRHRHLQRCTTSWQKRQISPLTTSPWPPWPQSLHVARRSCPWPALRHLCAQSGCGRGSLPCSSGASRSSASPVATSITNLAAWLKSRGRLAVTVLPPADWLHSDRLPIEEVLKAGPFVHRLMAFPTLETAR